MHTKSVFYLLFDIKSDSRLKKLFNLFFINLFLLIFFACGYQKKWYLLKSLVCVLKNKYVNIKNKFPGRYKFLLLT